MPSNKQIPVEKVRQIKGRLRKGSYQRIADELGLSYGYVSMVMNGERYSAKVIFQAISLVKEQEDEIKEKLSLIDIA